jgi:transcriptional regulator with XRE-family HTH domain
MMLPSDVGPKPGGSFGEELHRLRRQAGLNLADLADAAGCSITHISEIERGRRKPPDAETIHKILLRMGQESLLQQMIVLAARARGAVEISIEGKSDEETEILVAFAQRCQEGALDAELLQVLRALIDRGTVS